MLLNENRIFIIIREIILYATNIVFGIPGIHIIKIFYNHGTAKLSKMTHQNNVSKYTTIFIIRTNFEETTSEQSQDLKS